MKKNNLALGLCFFFAGIAFLLLAVLTSTKLSGIFWGLAGAGIVQGILRVYQYFYWTAPKHSQEYNQLLENVTIEQHDEMKIKIRDRAAHVAYDAGIIIVSVSMLVFSILGSLEIINNSIIIVVYLGGYLLFQLILNCVILGRLLKKYQ